MSPCYSPVIDLFSLPVDLQSLEYFDRLKAGKDNPDKAVKVTFKINSMARAVVDSIINDEDLSALKWLNQTGEPIFFLAS